MLCKKAGLITAAVVGGLLVASQTRLGDYAEVYWSKLTTRAQKQVPVEAQLERVKLQVEKLVPDMERNKGLLAEEYAAVKSLAKEIADTEEKLAKQLRGIQNMTEDLKTGKSTLVYDGKEYPAERIKAKLTRDLDSYKACEESLASRKQVLAAREKTVETIKQQLAAMNEQKRDLEVQIAQMETELQSVKLAESRNKFQIDDTRLSDIKQSLADVQRQLEVRKNKVTVDAEFASDPINVEKRGAVARDPLKEADDLLNRANGSKVTKAD